MFNFANGIGKFLCEYENDKEQKKEQFLWNYYAFRQTGQFDLP